ncbi:MAG: prolyl aminopeptidase [Hyphomicrobiales bacterium]
MTELRKAYPESEPYLTGRLRVSELHELYYEECGNPHGKPVVLLHGGPGGGSTPFMRRLHDPKAYRIILFDQRGSGRSTPHAELRENTTWDLVADIERLREHLGIEKWQVLGGSWGSTLALAYAELCPNRVSELVLRGVFMLRRDELLWFYQSGAHWIFPDAWEAFVASIPEAERGDMISAYYKRLTSPNHSVQLEAARAWSQWEGRTISLLDDPARVAQFGEDDFALAFARIECHYFIHRGFFDIDDQLLRHVDKIAHLPGAIIHGRYDVCTPLKNAWDLHKVWPRADFRIVPDAGHAGSEPGILDAILEITDGFR